MRTGFKSPDSDKWMFICGPSPKVSSPDPMVTMSCAVLLERSRQGVLAGLLDTPLKVGEGGGCVLFLGVEAFRFLGLGVAVVAADLAGEGVPSDAAGLVVPVAAGATDFLGLCRLGDTGVFSRRRLLEALVLPLPTWLGPATGELGRDTGRSPRPLGCAGRTLARKADWAADNASSALG